MLDSQVLHACTNVKIYAILSFVYSSLYANTTDVRLESWGLVGGLIAAAVVAIAALCCILAMAKKEKEGKPVFAPVHNPVNERVAEKA